MPSSRRSRASEPTPDQAAALRARHWAETKDARRLDYDQSWAKVMRELAWAGVNVEEKYGWRIDGAQAG